MCSLYQRGKCLLNGLLPRFVRLSLGPLFIPFHNSRWTANLLLLHLSTARVLQQHFELGLLTLIGPVGTSLFALLPTYLLLGGNPGCLKIKPVSCIVWFKICLCPSNDPVWISAVGVSVLSLNFKSHSIPCLAKTLLKHAFHFKKIRLLAGIQCKHLQVVHITGNCFCCPLYKCQTDWGKASTGFSRWTMHSSAGSTLILAIFVNILGGWFLPWKLNTRTPHMHFLLCSVSESESFKMYWVTILDSP